MSWKKTLVILGMAATGTAAAYGGFYLGENLIYPMREYRAAEAYIDENAYDEAIALFTGIAAEYDTGGQLARLGGFDDAPQRILSTRYEKAEYLRDNGAYDEAVEIFSELAESEEYGDSEQQVNNTLLCKAQELLSDGEYPQAIELLEELDGYDGGSYGNAQELLDKAHYTYAGRLSAIGKLEDAQEQYELCETYSDAWENLREVRYNLARNALLLSDFDTAGEWLAGIGTYEDAAELLDILESAVDKVYRTQYTDGSGAAASLATTYLWVHSVIVPGRTQDGILVKMQEDLVIGSDPDTAYFGAGSYEYTLELVRDAQTWYFTYYGSDTEDEAGPLVLEAAFEDGYTGLTTRKVYVSARNEEMLQEAQEEMTEVLEDEEDQASAEFEQEEEGDEKVSEEEEEAEDEETVASGEDEEDGENNEDAAETDASHDSSGDVSTEKEEKEDPDEVSGAGTTEEDKDPEEEEGKEENSEEEEEEDSGEEEEEGDEKASEEEEEAEDEETAAPEFQEERVWTEVEDEEVAEAVREGFRTRMRVELAESGNMAFYNDTDDERLTHYCSVSGCLNEGEYKATDAVSRRYYCSDHREEYEADPAYDGD